MRVHDDPVLHRQAGRRSQLDIGNDTDSHQDQIGRKVAAIVGSHADHPHFLRRKFRNRGASDDSCAPAVVSVGEKFGCHLRDGPAHHARHDIKDVRRFSQLAKHGCEFETDEPGSDNDNIADRSDTITQRISIAERADKVRRTASSRLHREQIIDCRISDGVLGDRSIGSPPSSPERSWHCAVSATAPRIDQGSVFARQA